MHEGLLGDDRSAICNGTLQRKRFSHAGSQLLLLLWLVGSSKARIKRGPMKDTLTNDEAVAYLLSIGNENGEKMPGTIRTKEKCPKCRKPFESVHEKIGFVCKEHQTVPQRFFIDVYFGGRQIKIYSHKSGLVLSSHDLALETLKHIQFEIRNKTFDPSRYVKGDIKKYLFENLVEEWYEDKRKDADKNCLAWSYVSKLRCYIENYWKPFFRGRDVREIRNVHIKGFKRCLPDKLSPKYIRNIMKALENFFNLLLQDEVIEKKPVFPVIALDEPVIKWCTREDQDALLNAIPDRHRFIFFFLTRQGLRPGEAMAMKWEDIDLQTGILTVKRTVSGRKIREKTKTKRVRPRLLHPDILDLLKSVPRGLPHTYLFTNPNTGKPYLPDTVNRLWNNACDKAKIEIKLYQATRHSVASMASTSGVDINIIKEVLGHTDIRTTQKYAHVDVLAQSRVFAAQSEKADYPQTSPSRAISFKKS
jgi:integrase